MYLPGHNFTGPSTKLDKRLNPDMTPKAWSKPINRVDEAAYHHDICYVKNKGTKTRNVTERWWKNLTEYTIQHIDKDWNEQLFPKSSGQRNVLEWG